MDNFEFHIKVPFHPRAKFGLKLSLVAVLFFAVGFGAYRFGSESGRKVGYRQGYESGWSDSQSSKVVTRTYAVSDLVHVPANSDGRGQATMSNLNQLIGDIEDLVEPTSWSKNGGPAEIMGYPPSLSLSVKQTQRGHDAVDRFLKERRSPE